MCKCRIGTAKFFTLLLLLYRTSVNADWFILVGIYADFPEKRESAVKATECNTIMLAFKNKEMKKFMDEVCLKKNPEIPDKMFGFGFNGKQDIRQTRGYAEERDMTPYLIENRIEEIANSFR